MKSKLLIRSALGVAALLLPVAATAAPTLSTEYRNASQFSEWFVRGDAAVSPSPTFAQGMRLAAWDGQDENDLSRMAVATAVYFFQIPAAARSVTVEVGYKADASAQNREVAGFLFVRDQAVERQYAAQAQGGASSVDEPGFYGDTYILPANQVRTAVTVPTDDRVVNGVLEVHLSAGAGQVVDVQYIQVTALGTEVSVPVTYASSSQYVSNPYDYTYPYYYVGPWYYPYPGYYVGFYCFDDTINPFWWDGWRSYRACFYTHHRWDCRPAFFHHHRGFEFSPAVAIGNDAYRHHWFREHFGVDAARASGADITRRVREHRAVVSADQMREFRDRARTVADEIQQSNHDLRAKMGDRFADRVREWNKDPLAARRELGHSDQSLAIQRAAGEWKATRPGSYSTATFDGRTFSFPRSGGALGSAIVGEGHRGNSPDRSVAPSVAVPGEAPRVNRFGGDAGRSGSIVVPGRPNVRSVLPERLRGSTEWQSRVAPEPRFVAPTAPSVASPRTEGRSSWSLGSPRVYPRVAVPESPKRFEGWGGSQRVVAPQAPSRSEGWGGASPSVPQPMRTAPSFERSSGASTSSFRGGSSGGSAPHGGGGFSHGGGGRGRR